MDFCKSALLLLLAAFALAAAVPRMNCFEEEGSDTVTFNHRDTFVITVRDASDGTKRYDCTCNGYSNGCDRLDCRLLSEAESNQGIVVVSLADDDDNNGDDDDANSNNNEETNEAEPMVVVVGAPQGCYDDVGRRYVERGMSVVRPGTPALGCKCPLTGSTSLACTPLSCALAPTPVLPLPADLDLRNCFDPWLNREVQNGMQYNRTRRMSAYQNEEGVYSCSCSYGAIRCSAIDIPCCDSATGEFKGAGEKVSVDYKGSLMSCTCVGGRSSYRSCRFSQRPSPGNPATLGGVAATPVIQGYCTDRYSGARYPVNSSFTQHRPSSGRYKCDCLRRSSGNGQQNFIQTRCRKMY